MWTAAGTVAPVISTNEVAAVKCVSYLQRSSLLLQLVDLFRQ